MPLFTYPPIPFALYDGELGQTSAAVAGATTVWLVGVTLYASAVLTNLRVHYGTAGNGHFDLGIYSDVSGVPTTLLAHCASAITGAGSLTTSTTVASTSPALIGGNLALSPGRYWLALWNESNTDQISRFSSNTGMTINMTGTNAGPLPAAASSISGLTNTNFKPIILGLLNGSWS